jgi:DNA-directed RNA polymerase subunit RPC12/RpoP
MQDIEDIKGRDLVFMFNCIECARELTVGHLVWTSIICEYCGIEITEKMIIKYGNLKGLSRSILIKKNNPTVISEFRKQLEAL